MNSPGPLRAVKDHNVGSLEPQKFIVSQFWRPKSSCGQATRPRKVLGKDIFQTSLLVAFSVPKPVDDGLPLTVSGGAWWAAVYGVTQSRTQLKQLRSSSSRAFPRGAVLGTASGIGSAPPPRSPPPHDGAVFTISVLQTHPQYWRQHYPKQ